MAEKSQTKAAAAMADDKKRQKSLKNWVSDYRLSAFRDC